MLPAWTSGYSSDIPYTLDFYREMAPAHLNFVCVLNGLEGLPAGKPLRYCDLGCGRGFGTALLAAANPDMEFVGIDFNPMHISEATALADSAGITNVVFKELSFAEAASSKDPQLARFDIVALHGVFNWVGAYQRSEIITFLGARLVPGGLVYLSYNVLPGWAVIMPLQRLLKEYANRKTGDSLSRLREGLQAVKVLADNSSAFVIQNPAVKAHIDSLWTKNQNYLVHEFLHDGWEPLYVADVMESMTEAKLSFVGSASISENRPQLSIPQNLMELIQSAPDQALRELLKDYAVNRQFRRDVYAKGRVRVTDQVAQRRYKELVFAAALLPEHLPEKWRIPAGEATLRKELLEVLASRLRERPAKASELMEISTKLGATEVDIPPILEVLTDNNILFACRSDFSAVSCTASESLNRAVLGLAPAGDTHAFLASPVLGSAIATTYFDRLAALVGIDGNQQDDQTAAVKIFDAIEGAGRKLMRDGKPMDRDQENLLQLQNLVLQFRTVTLPAWQRLGILR